MPQLPPVSEIPDKLDPIAWSTVAKPNPLLKKTAANTPSTKRTAHLDQPPISTRKLPEPVNRETKWQAKGVVGSLLAHMDSGKPLADAIPVIHRRQSTDAPLVREVFPDMDPALFKEIELSFAEDIRLRKELRENEDDNGEMPPSPGKEYDQYFIHAEIGVRKPEFSVSKHAHLFRDVKNKADLKKLMEHVEGVDKTLQKRYKRFATPELISKNMLQQHLAHKKKERQARKDARVKR